MAHGGSRNWPRGPGFRGGVPRARAHVRSGRMTTVTDRTAGAGSAAAQLLHMYRQMTAIRLFEERVNDLYTRALMPGLAHLYIGEEGVAVGVCEALRIDDYISS